MYKCIYIYMHTYIYIYICEYIYIYLSIYVCICIYIYIHMHAHVYDLRPKGVGSHVQPQQRNLGPPPLSRAMWSLSDGIWEMLAVVGGGLYLELHSRQKNIRINIRILQAMMFGIPLTLDLGTSMSDPYVYVVLLGHPSQGAPACRPPSPQLTPAMGQAFAPSIYICIHIFHTHISVYLYRHIYMERERECVCVQERKE